MNKILAFFKHNSWIWIVFVVIIAFFGDIYLQSILRESGPTPTPTPVPITASYKNVKPGVGSKEDLDRLLGIPLLTTTEGNKTTLEYSSTNVNRHQTAIIRNNKVVFFKEIVNSNDNKGIESVIGTFGEPPYILYNKSSNVSFNLYVYPFNGISYLAHPDGTLLEIWYFEPTIIDDFINKWATDYSLQPPTEYSQ